MGAVRFNPLHGSSPWRTEKLKQSGLVSMVSIRSTALHRGEPGIKPEACEHVGFNPLHGSSPWRTKPSRSTAYQKSVSIRSTALHRGEQADNEHKTDATMVSIRSTALHRGEPISSGLTLGPLHVSIRSTALHRGEPARTHDAAMVHKVSIRSTALHRGEPPLSPAAQSLTGFNPLHGSSPWRTMTATLDPIVIICFNPLHGSSPWRTSSGWSTWCSGLVFQSAPRLFTVENSAAAPRKPKAICFNPLHGSSPWRTFRQLVVAVPHLVSIRSTALHRGERHQLVANHNGVRFNPLHGSSPWRTDSEWAD